MDFVTASVVRDLVLLDKAVLQSLFFTGGDTPQRIRLDLECAIWMGKGGGFHGRTIAGFCVTMLLFGLRIVSTQGILANDVLFVGF